MKITGTNSYIKFDLENGHIMKAEGELLANRTFVVYRDTMKRWEFPYDHESISKSQIECIISEAKKILQGSNIKLIFD